MSTLNIPQQKGRGGYILIFIVLVIGSFLIYPLLFAKQKEGDRAQGRRIAGSRSCRHTSKTCDTTIISRAFEARKIREVKCTCDNCGKISNSSF
jgi:hypothetical protein